MCDCASVYCSKLQKLCVRAAQSLEMFPIAFSKTVFVFAHFKEWPAFCPLSRSHLGFHVVLSHYETILWMFIVFWLYSHPVLSWNDGSNFRQSLVVDICFYMGWPRGFASRIHRRLKFLEPCTFIAVETQSQPIDCVLSLCWDCRTQIISLCSKVCRLCDVSSKFKHFLNTLNSDGIYVRSILSVFSCYLQVAHHKSVHWQECFSTLSEIWMRVMTRQSVSDLHSPLFQVSNAHRMIAALTREMWVKAEVTKDLEVTRENRNYIITSEECTKHEDMKEDNEYCVWKRKYVYFKCMTVSFFSLYYEWGYS